MPELQAYYIMSREVLDRLKVTRLSFSLFHREDMITPRYLPEGNTMESGTKLSTLPTLSMLEYIPQSNLV